MGEALFLWYVRRGTQGTGFFTRQKEKEYTQLAIKI